MRAVAYAKMRHSETGRDAATLVTDTGNDATLAADARSDGGSAAGVGSEAGRSNASLTADAGKQLGGRWQDDGHRGRRVGGWQVSESSVVTSAATAQ